MYIVADKPIEARPRILIYRIKKDPTNLAMSAASFAGAAHRVVQRSDLSAVYHVARGLYAAAWRRQSIESSLVIPSNRLRPPSSCTLRNEVPKMVVAQSTYRFRELRNECMSSIWAPKIFGSCKTPHHGCCKLDVTDM